MRYLPAIVILFLFFTLSSCDWLMQDIDKNFNKENSEATSGEESKEDPPGGVVPSY